MSEKKNNKSLIIRGISLILVICFIGIVIWLLTYSRETTTITNHDNSVSSSLECNSSHPVEPFFHSSNSTKAKHVIRLLFKNDVLNEMSYDYDASFETEDDATYAEAVLHAKYNQYMGEHRLYKDDYSPSFNVIENKVRMSIYADGKKITKSVLPLFYIPDENFEELNDLKPKDLKNIYAKQGFTCSIH